MYLLRELHATTKQGSLFYILNEVKISNHFLFTTKQEISLYILYEVKISNQYLSYLFLTTFVIWLTHAIKHIQRKRLEYRVFQESYSRTHSFKDFPASARNLKTKSYPNMN